MIFDDSPGLVNTNFASFSHEQLTQMLYASNPSGVSAVGAIWTVVGTSLRERSTDLMQQLNSFEDMWTGGAADQFKVMIKDLSDGIEQVADTALAVRDLTYAAADALTDARNRMPAVVPVTPLSPAVIAIANSPLPRIAPPGDTVEAMGRRQAEARAAVDQHQAAQAAADAAHLDAVGIMTTLGTRYNISNVAMPATPVAAAPPTLLTEPDGNTVVVTSTGLTYTTDPNVGTVVTVTQPDVVGDTTGVDGVARPKPLFGQMFSSGLAAAAAALGGQFGHKVTDIVHPGTPGDVPATDAPPKTPTATGGGFGGGFGGGAGNIPQPTAAPLAAAPASALGGALGAAGALSAVGGGAGVAAGGMMGGGMMPMMPMGGMMGGDMNGAKRLPPWLVETEDVWGESSAVTPSVIGEME